MLYRTLDLYLWKRQLILVLPIFLILFVLFFASTMGQLVYNFRENDLPIHYLPRILLAQSPELILLLIGVALYIGIIIHLSSLNNSQESVIIMAVGLGKSWLMKNVILFSLPFLLVIGYIAFFLMPQGYNQTRYLGEKARAEINLKFEQHSLKTINKHFMFYVGQSLPNKHFQKAVLVINTDQQRQLIYAEHGQDYLKNNTRWLRLEHVMIYDLQSATPTISYANVIDLSLSEYLSNVLKQDFHRSIRMISSKELLQNWDDPHRAEFFWRLSYVISALLFCLFAIFIVRYKPRQSTLMNIIPAIIIFIIYSKLLVLIRQNTEHGIWSPELGYGGLYLAAVLLLYSLWLMSENRLFHRISAHRLLKKIFLQKQ